MENHDKIVFFHKYCHKCEFKKMPEDGDPCFDCLANPINQDSHRPLYFKPNVLKEKKDENKNNN